MCAFLRIKLWLHKFVKVRLMLVRVSIHMEILITICRTSMDCNSAEHENDTS